MHYILQLHFTITFYIYNYIYNYILQLPYSCNGNSFLELVLEWNDPFLSRPQHQMLNRIGRIAIN